VVDVYFARVSNDVRGCLEHVERIGAGGKDFGKR
jgi:hypothetical protein